MAIDLDLSGFHWVRGYYWWEVNEIAAKERRWYT